MRQLFSEIFEDARRLKIHKDELRRMLHEAFNSGGSRVAKISESYLRRIMPLEYKNATKIRLDYRIKRERKAMKSKTLQLPLSEVQTQPEQTQTENEPEGMKQLRSEYLREHDNPGFEDQGEIWTATGTVRFLGFLLVLIITVDSKEKKIVKVELDLSHYIANENNKDGNVD